MLAIFPAFLSTKCATNRNTYVEALNRANQSTIKYTDISTYIKTLWSTVISAK